MPCGGFRARSVSRDLFSPDFFLLPPFLLPRFQVPLSNCSISINYSRLVSIDDDLPSTSPASLAPTFEPQAEATPDEAVCPAWDPVTAPRQEPFTGIDSPTVDTEAGRNCSKYIQRKLFNKGNLGCLSSGLQDIVEAFIDSPASKLAALLALEENLRTLSRKRRSVEARMWRAKLQPALGLARTLRKFADIVPNCSNNDDLIAILVAFFPEMRAVVEDFNSTYRFMLTQSENKLRVGEKVIDVRQLLLDAHDGLLELFKSTRGYIYPFAFQNIFVYGCHVRSLGAELGLILSSLRGAAGPQRDPKNRVWFFGIILINDQDIWVDGGEDADVIGAIKKQVEEENGGEWMLRKAEAVDDLRGPASMISFGRASRDSSFAGSECRRSLFSQCDVDHVVVSDCM